MKLPALCGRFHPLSGWNRPHNGQLLLQKSPKLCDMGNLGLRPKFSYKTFVLLY
jgi:hypothetical protein